MNSDEYFVIADLHGRFDLLCKCFESIKKRTGNKSNIPTVIFLGDYVDRGPDSGSVVRYLINIQKTGQLSDGTKLNIICLKGNHEDMLWWDYVEKNELYDPKVLESFGGSIPTEELVWMRDLPLYYIQDNNIFVHAYWDPELNIEQNLKPTCLIGSNVLYNQTLWRRMDDFEPFKSKEYYLTHGHTPREHGPVKALNRINLDTKAYKTGRIVIGIYKYNIKGPIDFIEVKI